MGMGCSRGRGETTAILGFAILGGSCRRAGDRVKRKGDTAMGALKHT